MHLDTHTLLVCILIFFARIGDVSFGTMRTIAVVQGHRGMAWILAFGEILIWIFAVSTVLMHIKEQPAYAVSYALGYATGNYVGLTLERWLSFGKQVLRVFTRRGLEIADTLWAEGISATVFEGEGRDDAVYLLFIQTPRRDVPRIAKRARELDPNCYYIVDDIRTTSTAGQLVRNPSGWRSISKKK